MSSAKAPGFSAAFIAEHVFYFAAIAVAHYYGVIAATEATEVCQQDASCSRHLQPGAGIFGWTLDLADTQWRALRSAFPMLLTLAVVFLTVSHIVRRVASVSARLLVYIGIGYAFLGYMHGFSVIWITLLVAGNYMVGKLAGSHVWRIQDWNGQYWMIGAAPVCTWGYGIVIMFVNEWYNSMYRFGNISSSLAWMDGYGGVYRWHVGFNMVLLRMISFNMDRYWQAVPVGKHEEYVQRAVQSEKHGAKSLKARELISLDAADYSPTAYLAYLFYTPLFLAGPTMSFNSFMSQVITPQVTHTAVNIGTYALRWLLAAVMFECLLHHIPTFAINETGIFKHLRVITVCTVSYLTLLSLWLKFLLVWRFFRLWALLDGVETTENMNRCVCNNYTLGGFWQAWHRSFNRWLVRYVYIPLGGKRHRLRNVFVVFTFVALWHDMTMKLLAWGWLLAIFFVPETLLGNFARTSEWFKNAWYYRIACGLGAAVNIFFLMAANLVGYSIGIDGVKHVLGKMGSSLEGIAVFVAAMFLFFCASNLMFLVRQLEKQRAVARGEAVKTY